MAVHVSTFIPRFTFVKGEVTTGTPAEGFVACGPGTGHPMLVSPSQLAEILYRVKDAWFTSGSVSTMGYPEGGPPEAGYGLSMEGGDPPAQLITSNAYGAFIRGYCWWGNNFDLHASDAAYFNPPYGPDILPDSVFDYLGYFFPATVEPVVPVGESFYREISSEIGIWLPEKTDIDPFVNETARINGEALRTGFSQEMIEDSGGSGYMIDNPAQSQLRLEIYPEVAWVDTVGSGNPFSVGNSLYLKMRFGVIGTAMYETIALDTNPDLGFSTYVEATDLVFQLADSTCTAKIYCYTGIDPLEFDSATPFVITAKEWWPYAKGSPATPVWESSTGVKL